MHYCSADIQAEFEVKGVGRFCATANKNIFTYDRRTGGYIASDDIGYFSVPKLTTKNGTKQTLLNDIYFNNMRKYSDMSS